MRTIAKFLLVVCILLPFSASAFTIGAVSDLHNGQNNNAAGVFEETANEMQKKGADIIIVTGDMVDNGKSNYAGGIKEVSQKVDIPILWVKGNHDGKSFKIFSAETNYYRDFGNWRVIVLDSNGDLNKGEIAFLKKSLDTDKDVVIAMHHPVLKKKSLKLSSKFKNFRKALTPNVKAVLSGHWHQSWKKLDNGIEFEGLPLFGNGKHKMIDL